MKKKLLNSMRVFLVAAGLCVGTSAWAQITGLPTTYTTSFAEDVIAPFESNAAAVNCSANGYVLRVNASRGSTETSTAYFDSDTSTDGNQAYTPASNENITISFTMLNGYYSYTLDTKFAVVNSEGTELLSFTYGANPCKFTDVSIGGSTVDGFESFTGISWNTSKSHNANGVNDGTYPFTSTAGDNPEITILITGKKYVSITFNQSSKSISNKTYSKTLSDVTIDLAKIQISNALQNRSGVSGSRASCFKNITISSETVTKEMANYTIAYKDRSGSTIKMSRVVTGYYEDDDVVVLDSDKDLFYSNDGSMKYVYYSDDSEGMTIASDGSTVVTVTFDSYEKRNYSVNAVDGKESSIKTNIQSGYIYTDNTTASFYIPACVLVDGTLYFTDEYSKTETVSSNNQVFSYAYTTSPVSDVKYFYEGEDLNATGSTYAGLGSSSSKSNGSDRRPGGYANMYTPALEGGVYTVYIRVYGNNAKTPACPLYYCDADGSNPVSLSLNTPAATAAAFSTIHADNVAIPDGKSLCFYNGGSKDNSNFTIDYIYLIKSADYISFTLGADASDSYKSYVTTGNTDFATLGVTAYIAKAADTSNGTVTLSTIDTAPANTPVLLKGTKGEYATITTTSTNYDAPETNYLVAADGSTAIGASEAKYVLAYNSSWEFRHYNGTLSAGKVYLDLSSLGVDAARLSFIFDDETTGINIIKDESNTANSYYNLNGQRVNQPGKGLYIVNGKKVLVNDKR